ncbi:hypothetical protein LSTR_LSTR015560 [Laodelphax striatellus]|uniref:Uncharacterized protein n=1 Tax=Laodelphax striatellus TaxID=195883 RepID=A0A482WXR8_LAOST|nr:hypothetical protein LSTR_LSTR003975 [Laodelphax striatellus]RZF37840.1 hypothetical protein LSTR_LSTR015560 [Laodelphax striatellus]
MRRQPPGQPPPLFCGKFFALGSGKRREMNCFYAATKECVRKTENGCLTYNCHRVERNRRTLLFLARTPAPLNLNLGQVTACLYAS